MRSSLDYVTLATDDLDPETGMFGPLDRVKLDEACNDRLVEVRSLY